MHSRVFRPRLVVLTCALALVAPACSDNSHHAAAPTATTTATPLPTPTPTNPVLNHPVDETVAAPGLSATTYVAVDSLGMPHIYGPDMTSVLYAQGYETAKVRFWQMDAFRRFAEGRLSELFGALTLDGDIEMRTIFTTRDGRRLEEALWERVQNELPEVAAQAQAYADGINAWLADLRSGRNGATLPPEYTVVNLLPADLAEWRPQDTLAVGRLQAYSLSETIEDELGRADVYNSVPEPIRRDVFRSAPAAPATVLPVTQDNAEGGAAAALASTMTTSLGDPAIVHQARAMMERLMSSNPLGTRATGVGSNNWIVSPQLSANGHAMLANDPHLQLFNPPIWHMVQLDAADMRVTGVNFPGLPGVILGHNDYGAWGATVSGFDVTDLYVETVTTPPDYPASPRTVLFNGQQVPVIRLEEQFNILNGAPVTAVIEVVPHHGPMLPDPDRTDNVEGLAATNMTVRWTGHEITLDSRFLLNLNHARNVDEFKAAIRDFAVGGQNWVWADINGDIAYFPYVLVPQRPAGTVPFLPMPGTGEAEWLTDASGNTAWLPEEKFPQAVNPPEGFLSSANNDQLGNTLDNDPLNDPVYFFFTADIGFREQRIQDMLSNRAAVRPPGAKIGLTDMSTYQYDTSSLEASRLVPFLFAAAEARPDLVTPDMNDALTRLHAWGTAQPGSPAWTMSSGVDPADTRDDVPPRTVPVSDEERADAVATSIYAGWSTRLARDVYMDDFAGFASGLPGQDDATKGLLHILEDIDRTDPGFVVYTKGTNGESTLWDDKTTPAVETRDEIMLRALAEALPFLQQQFGSSNPADWLWGLLHEVRFQHFFGQAGIPSFDLGNFPAPGGRFTVNPGGYSIFGNTANSFVFSDGPSERFVAILDPAGIQSVNILPGGNNGNPGKLDPAVYNHINPAIHYGDFIPGWLDGQVFEYRVSRDQVAADTQLLIRYDPED